MIRVSVRVSLVWLVSGSSLVGLCRHLDSEKNSQHPTSLTGRQFPDV